MFSTSEGPEVCRDLEIIPQDFSTQMKDANEIQTMTGALLVAQTNSQSSCAWWTVLAGLRGRDGTKPL